MTDLNKQTPAETPPADDEPKSPDGQQPGEDGNDGLDWDAIKASKEFQQIIAKYRKTAKEAQAEKERLQREREEAERKKLEEQKKYEELYQQEAEAKREELMSQLTSQIEAAKKELQAQAEAFAMEIAQKLLGRAV